MTNSAKNIDEPSFKTSPQQFMALLDELGISYRNFEHEAVFTVEESHKVTGMVPGAHCRNLALYNKKKQMWLVTLRDQTPIDLKKLEVVLGCGRLSFMRPERLWDALGVRAGSVTPFSIMNDVDQQVTLVLEKEMLDEDLVNYHPMINTMSLALKPSDLLKFVDHTKHRPVLFLKDDVQPD